MGPRVGVALLLVTFYAFVVVWSGILYFFQDNVVRGLTSKNIDNRITRPTFMSERHITKNRSLLLEYLFNLKKKILRL